MFISRCYYPSIVARMNNFKETISRLARFFPQHRSSESLPGYLHHLLGKSQGMEGVLTAGAASVEMPLAGEMTEFTSEGIKTKYPASPERRLVKYGAICDAGLLFAYAQTPFLSFSSSSKVVLCHRKEI